MAESSLVTLARKTIETYIKEGHTLEVPSDVPSEMKGKAGVFVSLHKHGQLRGCIGTFMPTTVSLAEEIIRNAVSSATQDPRFDPVRPEELTELEISVDVLSPPEPIKSIAELDPKKYGVIVTKGYQRGLLLPDLEGVATVEQQLMIAMSKAGIADLNGAQISRFEVKRYH